MSQPPCNNDDVQEYICGLLQQQTTNEKITGLWKTLTDGKVHAADQLAKSCGYPDRRAHPFMDLVNILLELGLATKNGTVVSLSDIAFPFGRP